MTAAFRHFLLLLLISSVFIIPAINGHETEQDETQQPVGMEHRCIHDELVYDPEFADIDEDLSALNQDDSRILASTTYPKLRIVGYYAPLIANAPAAFASYIQNQLVPPVFSYFESALRVKFPVQGTLKLASSVKSVCGVATPQMLYNGVNADFVMMFDSNNNQASSFTASSRYCFLSSRTNRPIVAFTNFNRKYFTAANGNMVLHEQNMYTLIHEFTHAFGFSQSSFPYFIDSTGKTLKGHIKTAKIGGLTRTVLDVAPLTSRLRKFYGCSTLQGAILENNGGTGTAVSHFERRFFTYEIMSSGAIDGSRMSEFSLAALEGSGWYAPDYSYAEPFFFGQGMGCGFLTGVCGTNSYNFPEEFCTGSSRGCAPNGMSGGYCQTENTMIGCRWHKPSSYLNCENVNSRSNARLPGVEVYQRGGVSKCFTGNLSTSRSASSTSFCFKYNCVGSGASTKLQVLIGNVTATCLKKGKMTVDGYYGAIDCPDPLTFCGTVGKKYCPRGCMGRGICTNNKCVCKAGFKGIDCAQKA